MVLNRNCPICDKRNGEKIEHICMNVPEICGGKTEFHDF